MEPEWLLPGPVPAAIETSERCAVTELLNDPACPEVSLALATVAPGVTTRLHVLNGIAERYVIRAGRGRVEVGGVWENVRPGDRILIAAGETQRVTNTGPDALELYCVHAPVSHRGVLRSRRLGAIRCRRVVRPAASRSGRRQRASSA